MAVKKSAVTALISSIFLFQQVIATQNDSDVTVVNEGGGGGNDFWESEDVWGECHTGQSQSPIVIFTDDVIVDKQLEKFSVSSDFSSPLPTAVYHRSTNTYVLQNEGEGGGPTVSEGGNQGQLSFLMLALFFGSPSSHKGSQHSLDENQYPAEVDLYFGDGTAVNTSTNLIAWSVFVEISNAADDVESASLKKLFENAKSLGQLGDSMEMNGEIKLSELTHAGNNDKMEDFFRYSGSLTAPPCEENVQWTVFEHPIYVTSATYAMLFDSDANTVNDEVLLDNFRPPLPLNGRRVTKPKNNYPNNPAWATPLLLLLVTFLRSQVN